MSSLPPAPRPRRRWSLFVGGFFLGGTVILGLLLAPPIQGWLLRHIVATRPGWQLNFERIGFGPTGLDARGVEFAMPGVAASSAPIAIRISPTRLFSERELRVERIEARRVRLTITPAQFAASTPEEPLATPFNGILRQLQAPLPWAIDAAHLDGEVVVRDAGESRLTGLFSLRGGGLTSSSPGVFEYELAANSMILPPGPTHTFSSKGTLHLEQSPDHGLARITISGDLRLPHYGKLSFPVGQLTAEVIATANGEKYVAHVTLGSALKLDLQAALDASHESLTGRVTLTGDQTALASILGERVPHAAVSGDLTFTLNLRNGDLDAAITGDLETSDWQKWMPQLAAFDAFNGRLTAAIVRRGEELTLKILTATLRGEKSPAEVSVTLLQPLNFKNLSGAPFANVSLAHWPIEWANPFLKDAEVRVAPGELSASWMLAVDHKNVMRLSPTGSATIGPLVLLGEKLPPLPPMSISFRPRVDASARSIALTLDEISVVSTQGDRIDAQLAMSRDSVTGELHVTGKLEGALPTLFALDHGQLPFELHGAWDTTLSGSTLRLAALEFTAYDSTQKAPYVSLKLLQSFAVDLEKHRLLSLAKTPAPTLPLDPSVSLADLMQLRFSGAPLSWLSRWIPGKTVTGTLTKGESILRSSTETGLVLDTPTPWQLSGVSLSDLAVAPTFLFNAQLSPHVTLREDQLAIEITDIAVKDQHDNRLAGRLAGAGMLLAQTMSAELAFEADLPALPHSAETFGPLHASLEGKFHTMSSRIMGADEFSFRVKNSSGDLVVLTAPLPFVFGLSDSNMVVVSTLAPLALKLGHFPLSWLKPWSGELDFDGTTMPTELNLSSTVNKFSVRADKPWTVENFSVRQKGQDFIRDATLTFQPGLDLLFICVAQPKFEMAYTGRAHLTETKIDIAGRNALDLDVGLSFKGNDKVTLPDGIDLSSRVDFAALPSARSLGLPGRGTLVARVNGDLLGGEPVELWARLAGLPAATPTESLPSLEVMLRGKLSRENIFTGGVELLLATSPQPTDAKFDVDLNLIEGGLKITSGFHSQFIDGAALLALARAFATPTTAAVPSAVAKKTVVVAKSTRASDATLPFWGELSGSFDLDIGAVQFAPYRIDRVRGRLDADRLALNLHDLGGEMFAGRWGGGLRIEHELGNTTGNHTLAGAFHIEQFESARVVHAVFPNQLASVDARINVHANVTSHGNSFIALLDQSAADFLVDGEHGIVRLTVPKVDLVSTAAVFGGTILLSPELRALGRLLKKFAEMPVDQLRITGRRAASGEVTLDEFRFDSPQARLSGRGRIPNDGDEPLMNRPLELSLQLAAKDELAVILGGMSLLEKKPSADGFRSMREPFSLGGRAGAPDTAPLYNLFAKAVGGSSGTWGFLMRKMQAEVVKKKTPLAR